MSVILTYFLIFQLILAVNFAIGTLVIQTTFPKHSLNRSELLFAKLLVSTVLLSAFTAIVKSGGVTLQWFLLTALIFMFFANDGKRFSNPILNIKKPDKKEFLRGLIIWLTASIWFIWQAVNLKGLNIQATELPHKDIIFYADVSQNLMIHGQENSFLYGNTWFPELNGIVPYHYFELWLNGLFSQITGHHLQTFQLITQTWFLLLSVFGFAAVFSRFHQNTSTIQAMIAGIFGLFIIGLSGTIIFSNSGFWSYSDAMVYNPAMVIFQKVGVLLPFFLAAGLGLMHRAYRAMVIILLMLPIVSVAAAPALIPATVLLVLWLFIRKNMTKKLTLNLILYILLYSIAAFSFVHFFGSPVLKDMGIGLQDSLKFYNKAYLADSVYLFQNIPFIHLFAVAPFLILLLIFRFKSIKRLTKENQFLPIVIIIWCCAFCAWLLLRFHGYDAIQFFSIPAGILLSLSCFGLLMSVSKNTNIVLLLLFIFGSFGSIQAYQHNQTRNINVVYSASYCSKVFAINEKLNNPNKAFILAESAYLEESDFVPYFKRAAWFLALDDKTDVLISIGTEHLPNNFNDWNLFKRTQWDTSVFGMFAKKVMKNNPNTTWNECQKEFIKTYEIEVVFLGKGAQNPEWLSEMEDYSLTDEESGETCIILKIQ